METPPYWVLEQLIAENAYYKWQNSGCPPNQDLFFWLEAERELWESIRNEVEPME